VKEIAPQSLWRAPSSSSLANGPHRNGDLSLGDELMIAAKLPW
jgi:hypothetical protein